MIRISTAFSATALALTSLILSAEDFQPLMATTQTTWPEKHHIGVICNYKSNRSQVDALALAAGEGYHITVVDTVQAEQANAAADLLAKQKADFVVLMPQDRNFRDGSFGATVAINRLSLRGVPAVGTLASALKQGATFSLGVGTEGKLLVNDKLLGTIDVTMPNRARISQNSNLVLTRTARATIRVSRPE
jgi:hypothetical protein